MSESLKPCRCGGEATIKWVDDKPWLFVTCTQCGARGDVYLTSHGNTRDDAILDWNRRASQPASDTSDPRDEVIAEMREALRDMIQRFEIAAFLSGSDDEFVKLASEKARAALSKREGAK